MHVLTTRFGILTMEHEDVILFPEGLVGLRECRNWVLLADTREDSVAWLQSTQRADIALAVVGPRRFVPDYQLRIPRDELAPIGVSCAEDAEVLAIVGKHNTDLTLNLKAPLVINLPKRLGKQVVDNHDQPVRHVLCAGAVRWKQSA